MRVLDFLRYCEGIFLNQGKNFISTFRPFGVVDLASAFILLKNVPHCRYVHSKRFCYLADMFIWVFQSLGLILPAHEKIRKASLTLGVISRCFVSLNLPQNKTGQVTPGHKIAAQLFFKHWKWGSVYINVCHSWTHIKILWISHELKL